MPVSVTRITLLTPPDFSELAVDSNTVISPPGWVYLMALDIMLTRILSRLSRSIHTFSSGCPEWSNVSVIFLSAACGLNMSTSSPTKAVRSVLRHNRRMPPFSILRRSSSWLMSESMRWPLRCITRSFSLTAGENGSRSRDSRGVSISVIGERMSWETSMKNFIFAS